LGARLLLSRPAVQGPESSPSLPSAANSTGTSTATSQSVGWNMGWVAAALGCALAAGWGCSASPEETSKAACDLAPCPEVPVDSGMDPPPDGGPDAPGSEDECVEDADCGTGVCIAGACCGSSDRACGDACCGDGEVCLANQCVAPGA